MPYKGDKTLSFSCFLDILLHDPVARKAVFNHHSDLQALVAQKGWSKTLKYPQLLTVLASLVEQEQ